MMMVVEEGLGHGRLTVIGSVRCIRRIAGDIEDSAHDSDICRIGGSVACSRDA